MKPKIAICFFGITRSATYTIDSIEENVFRSARKLGEVKVLAHFFDQAEINNPRSGEFGQLRSNEYKLLKPDWLQLELPNICLKQHDFEYLSTFGDRWSDDFQSLSNLVHQLHSLDKVTTAALEWDADIYIFCRPDLIYHDSLSKPLNRALRSLSNTVFLPNWHGWSSGYNDRFAICNSKVSAQTYGQRIRRAADFCIEKESPLHSEQLVRYALIKENLPVKFISSRASRVRFDGVIKNERFFASKLEAIIINVQHRVALLLGVLGVKENVKGLLRRKQSRNRRDHT